ncbi:MAG: DNA recombination protein RmuC [Acidobacteriia bacterium]|nr:DNA recombination protein RmuC [Terriglobia bacterium]
MTALLLLILVFNVAVLLLLALILRRSAQAGDPTAAVAKIGSDMLSLERGLSQSFAKATADIAQRLEQTKGDLRQEVTDRLTTGFKEIHTSVEEHLVSGRREQSAGLAEARKDLTSSLSNTTAQLKTEFDGLNQRTEQKLEAIRAQVDQKLFEISGQVQQKLTENMKEGFAQFEKVQQHLKAAEEQLRQVGTIGNSINDLNNLLKLPHLRGRFGEASLERLLEDFLPAHMYELQYPLAGGRVDAVIKFPDRVLPIDAKFPREQVLPLFETSNEHELEDARAQLVKVLTAQAKSIAEYLDPEHGTMDVALMYLPSETLYLEAIRSTDAMEALSRLQVFPVSPNTLLMTLRTVALAYKWYEVAARFEETRGEIAKAQRSLGFFQAQFDSLGNSLEKAQKAYETAAKHLKTYRNRVTDISGEEIPEQLELTEPPLLSKAETSGQ